MIQKRMMAVAACAVIVSIAFAPALGAQGTSAIWRAFAEKLEPGKTLKVRLKTGERFKATLLQVVPQGMIVQPKTRAAVPPQQVPYDSIETLEIDQAKGIGMGKAVAVGAGVAAGAWLALMAITFAILGD